ncbi:MAG TPA: aldo/keto reductase [Clostridia bacterium]|nr:aldo/keto reductase [Clostridia bacterium]
MLKRILGRTGLEVSVIGFGGIPIQRISREESEKLIVEAYENGINFIDTARGYSVSEDYIGTALQNNNLRSMVILATKSPAKDYMTMKSEVETSLEMLRTNYIDLYQFHNVRNIEQLETIMGEDGAYKALEEAKENGKIGHIGITCHSADVLMEALKMDEFETIQFPYNYIENQGEPVFEQAAKQNVGIICMKPIAGGAIEKGELSIQYILDNQNITVAIPGMDCIDQVARNAAVGNDLQPITAEGLEILESIKKELGDHFCRRCGYCLPCPQGIDIPTLFSFEGYYLRYNMSEWPQGRYDNLQKHASDCIECGLCESKCPYNLPIRDMLKHVKETFGQ